MNRPSPTTSLSLAQSGFLDTDAAEAVVLTQHIDIRVAVIGLGHVGLPTALGLAELGWPVAGADDDVGKAQLIAQGNAPFYEPGLEELLRRQLANGRFTVASDAAAAVRQATIVMVCVGTPQREDGSANLSYIERAGRMIAENLNGYKLIVEKSTTPVQTAERLRQIIKEYDAAAGAVGLNAAAGPPDFDVAVNPEFLREGSALCDFFNPDRIVIGADSRRASDLLTALYRPLFDRMGESGAERLVVTGISTAEIIKHAANAFLATKVSFINMVADLCEAMGADITDVAQGLGLDHRIAPEFLQAGIGFGGYCLPKDIRAFERVARENGVDFGILREVERANRWRIDKFIAKVREALGNIEGKKIAVWGLSFKPGTDDIRDAPSLAVVERLIEEGALLRLHDPYAMDAFQQRFPARTPMVAYAASPEDAAAGADTIVLLTEWPEYGEVDLAGLRRQMAAAVIIDGRNMLTPTKARETGFRYYSIGRP